MTVPITKGGMGFGFTIADSAYGQKVKKILDRPRCKTLQEGDILVEINGVGLRGMSHSEVLQVLKECPRGQETNITIQRGHTVSQGSNIISTLIHHLTFKKNCSIISNNSICLSFSLNHALVADQVVVPSAPTYDPWMDNNDDIDSLPSYHSKDSHISRPSLPNYEDAMAMSYVSTSLHI